MHHMHVSLKSLAYSQELQTANQGRKQESLISNAGSTYPFGIVALAKSRPRLEGASGDASVPFPAPLAFRMRQPRGGAPQIAHRAEREPGDDVVRVHEGRDEARRRRESRQACGYQTRRGVAVCRDAAIGGQPRGAVRQAGAQICPHLTVI